ncbi:hypothetical protein F5876DRAFT_79901 [Lentinula aff. lateritia]|uniref:Uncharacterized protein n=1 Tax=Lentinula aff. lateritia TaxID=2804960 RepID=A0ACC1TR73_9AGAR|nr:hypothetical protein F5876DRAFT_79901 [Lentinula aff. lateritia]
MAFANAGSFAMGSSDSSPRVPEHGQDNETDVSHLTSSPTTLVMPSSSTTTSQLPHFLPLSTNYLLTSMLTSMLTLFFEHLSTSHSTTTTIEWSNLRVPNGQGHLARELLDVVPSVRGVLALDGDAVLVERQENACPARGQGKNHAVDSGTDGSNLEQEATISQLRESPPSLQIPLPSLWIPLPPSPLPLYSKDSMASLSSSGSTSTHIALAETHRTKQACKETLPNKERCAGDPIVYSETSELPSPFDSLTICKRVSTQGVLRLLEPFSDLPAFSIPPQLIGVISERAVRRYIAGCTFFEHKFSGMRKAIEQRRRKHLQKARKDTTRNMSALKGSVERESKKMKQEEQWSGEEEEEEDLHHGPRSPNSPYPTIIHLHSTSKLPSSRPPAGLGHGL